MRYFTRDLYRRCRSTDEAILDAACEEWKQANEVYERHLTAILPEFPSHLREFTELLLQDAKVQSIARQGELQSRSPDVPRSLVRLMCRFGRGLFI